MEYNPNRWVVLAIYDGDTVLHKVLAGWYGGYLDGDSWQLNSGITKIEEDGDYYLFHGYSGSIYKCNKNGYGFTGLTAGIYKSLKDKASSSIDLLKEEEMNVLRQTYS